ncbi:nucleotidyltransferase domain-containing protein [candidate division KSB1 bacterium]|nr:nucleotidyltransferase domain-containing protein [candidate division KSB1 bacterium]
MAEVTDSTMTILKKYIKELEKNHLQIRSAILFGSYAKGNYNEWSDRDIDLVSDDFQGIRFYDRQRIARITIDVDSRISPFPYKTKDFTKDDMFVEEILKTGVRIV